MSEPVRVCGLELDTSGTVAPAKEVRAALKDIGGEAQLAQASLSSLGAASQRAGTGITAQGQASDFAAKRAEVLARHAAAAAAADEQAAEAAKKFAASKMAATLESSKVSETASKEELAAVRDAIRAGDQYALQLQKGSRIVASALGGNVASLRSFATEAVVAGVGITALSTSMTIGTRVALTYRAAIAAIGGAPMLLLIGTVYLLSKAYESVTKAVNDSREAKERDLAFAMANKDKHIAAMRQFTTVTVENARAQDYLARQIRAVAAGGEVALKKEQDRQRAMDLTREALKRHEEANGGTAASIDKLTDASLRNHRAFERLHEAAVAQVTGERNLANATAEAAGALRREQEALEIRAALLDEVLEKQKALSDAADTVMIRRPDTGEYVLRDDADPDRILQLWKEAVKNAGGGIARAVADEIWGSRWIEASARKSGMNSAQNWLEGLKEGLAGTPLEVGLVSKAEIEESRDKSRWDEATNAAVVDFVNAITNGAVGIERSARSLAGALTAAVSRLTASTANQIEIGGGNSQPLTIFASAAFAAINSSRERFAADAQHAQQAAAAYQDALDRLAAAQADGDDAALRRLALERELRNAHTDSERAVIREVYAIESANRARRALTEGLGTFVQRAAASASRLLTEISDINERIAIESANGDAAKIREIERTRELAEASNDYTRSLLEQLYAIEDVNRVAREAAEEERTLQDLRVEALRAGGREAEARELEHQIRLAGATSDAQRELIDLIFSLNEAAIAAREAADAQRALADAQHEIEDLEVDILRSQGRDAEADNLALQHEYERRRQAALDNDKLTEEKRQELLGKIDDWFAAKQAELGGRSAGASTASLGSGGAQSSSDRSGSSFAGVTAVAGNILVDLSRAQYTQSRMQTGLQTQMVTLLRRIAGGNSASVSQQLADEMKQNDQSRLIDT